MHLPISSWKTTLTKLGFRRIRRQAKRPAQRSRRLQLEALEPRQLLAADLSVGAFTADGYDLHIDYTVSGEAAQPMTVGVYRSRDGGATLDAEIAAQTISDTNLLSVGAHQLTISPDFSDVQEDYALFVVLDTNDDVAEPDETNNELLFAGGVFQAADGTIHIHGGLGSDEVDINDPSPLKMKLNGSSYDDFEPVSGVHIRLHGDNDVLTTKAEINTPLWAFGGAGQDELAGGMADDYLDGGGGDDLLEGQGGNDTLKGRGGDDTLLGGGGDDLLEGQGGHDTLDGGEGDDTLMGQGGHDSLTGGPGNDNIDGSGGKDTIAGGKGIDTIEGTTEPNTAPTGDITDTSADEDNGVVIDLAAAFEDAEHLDEELAFTIVGNTNPALIAATAVEGTTLTITPAADASGSSDLTVRATDPLGLFVESTFTLTIFPVNDAPTGTLGDINVNEDAPDQQIDLRATFDDVDHTDEELSFELIGNSNPALFTSAAIVASTGTLALAFAENQNGTSTLTVRATDPLGAQAERSFNVNVASVNDPPTGAIGDITVQEDAANHQVDLRAAFDDVDHLDADLDFSVVGNTNPALFNATMIAADGTLTLDFAEHEHGASTLTIRATDPLGGQAEAAFDVQVTSVNDAPTGAIGDVSVDEDAPDQQIDLRAAFEDVDHSDTELSFEVTGNTNPALFSSVLIDSDDVLTLSLAGNVSGTATLTLRATDPLGAHSEQSFQVDVAAVNDAPTTTGLSDINQPSSAAPLGIDLRSAFDDVEDGASGLTYSIVGNTNPSFLTQALIDQQAGTLSLSYVQELASGGELTVRATDSEGGFVETSFTVNITYDPPVGMGIPNIAVLEDSADVTIHLPDYFTDPIDAVEDLTFQVVGNTNDGLVGTTIDEAAGNLVLAFAPDGSGMAEVTVRAINSTGASAENVVLVEVGAVNDAPIIGTLLDGPDPAIEGADLTLQLDGFQDDSASAEVRFYRDADGDGQLNTAFDQLLGSDGDGSDGWSLTVSTAGFGTGGQTYFARAADAEGLSSQVASATGSVGIVGVLDDAEPGYSEVGSGWVDGSDADSFGGGHREHAAGDGSAQAIWDFTGLLSAPHRVFATWAADSDRATDAPFTVYDGSSSEGTFLVNQQNAPGDFFDGTRWWHQLGTFDVDHGALTIELSDNADGIVVADAIRVLDPVPTIDYLSGDRSSVVQGTPLLLTAYGVEDKDGSVQSVEFYRDANDDGVWDSGDTLLGTDTIDGDGWSHAADTTSLSTGSHTFFARAFDDQSNPSDPADFAATVTANVTSGLVAHWKLNESSGTSAADAAGSHDGTVADSAAWGGGFAGGGLSFDGVNDHVAVGNPATLDVTGQITISAWVKPEATDGIRNIVAHGYTRSPDGEVFLRIKDGQYQVGSWNGSDHKTSYAVASEDIGNWVHLAGVYDGTTWRLYRNGVEVSASADATGAVSVNEDWAIGSRGTGTERYFKGAIDEVRVYDRGLAASEISQIIDTAANTAPTIEAATFKLPPGSATGTVVGTVSFDDVDAQDTLTLAITAGNDDGVFAIHASSGEITVADGSTLDFATNASYELTVEVTDDGDPALSRTATIVIQPTSLTDQLTGHWRFNEGSGTVAGDETATQDGTLVGDAGWTGGLTGTALQLDGSGDYLSLGDPAALDITGQITISAWVKPEATDGIRNIVAHGHTFSPEGEVFLRIQDGNYEIGSWNGSDHLTQATVAAEDIGNWVHLAGVYDGTTWRLYRNGVEVSSSADATGAVSVNEDWAIGARGTGTERFFQGAIDEVRIYERALTSTEVGQVVETDNAPPIVERQLLGVASSATNGTVVGTVDATDPNSDSLTYAITAGNDDGAFAIDGVTGEITVADSSALDFINQTAYELTVQVSDDGSPALADSAIVTIVQDNLANGLIGYWGLSEGAGTVAADATGAHEGTLAGDAAWTTGIEGYGLQLDGVGDHVSLGDPATLNITGQITISAWVKPEATDGIRNIVAHGYTRSPDGEVFLRIKDGNYEIGSWDGTDHLAQASVAAEDIGNWVHLAGVYDGTTWRLYRNGVEVSSSADATGAVSVNEDWAIGSRGTGTERFFQGAVDEVRIYDRGLTAGDVADLASQATTLTALTGPSVAIAGMSVGLAAQAHESDQQPLSEVRVYHDANGNGLADDTVLATDSDGSDGWNFSIDTTGLGTGQQTFLAEGVTSTGTTNLASAVVDITDDQAILDNGDSAYSESGTGWTMGGFDLEDAFGGDYQAAYLPEGTNTASWKFENLPAGTFDVHVTYVDAANHTNVAAYSILNGTETSRTTFVDQSTPVTADLVDGGHSWEKIGRATLDASGDLTVQLTAGGSLDQWAVADGVRLTRVDTTEGIIDDVELHLGLGSAEEYSVDLDEAFANVEGLSGELTYTVTGNTNPSALDSIEVDNSTNMLTLLAARLASGVSEAATTITVEAQDSQSNVAQAVFQASVSDNLIKNGGFEEFDLAQEFDINTGWIFLPEIPDWEMESVGRNFELQRGILGGPQEGSQHLEIDAHPLPGSAVVSQSVGTNAGMRYQLRFAFSGRPGTGIEDNHLGVELYDVATDGTATAISFDLQEEQSGASISGNAPQLPGDSGWQYYTATFTAVGETTKLQFSDKGAPQESDTLGIFLDDVSIRKQYSLSIDATPTVFSEYNESAIVSVSHDGPTDQSVLAKVKHVDKPGDAELGVDFDIAEATFVDGVADILIPAGQAVATFTVNPIDDAIFEGLEQIEFELVDLQTYMIAIKEALTAIEDDESAVSPATVDLDIDSDNNDGLDKNWNRTAFEDSIEDDASRTGKIVPLTEGDADEDNIADWQDGYNRDGQADNDDDQNDELFFTPMVLEVPTSVDLSTATFKFVYSDSDPMQANEDGPETGHLRIWKKDGSDARTAGDYIGSGEVVSAAALGFDANNRTVTLYVEKVANVNDTNNRIGVTRGTGGSQDFSALDHDYIRVGCNSTDESEPTVTITATNAYASESNGDIGEFTVSRGEGNTSDDLQVYYEVTVDSEAPDRATDPGADPINADYDEKLAQKSQNDGSYRGSVIIPEGQSSVLLTVTPDDDAVVEWDEKVTVTLIEQSGYSIDESSEESSSSSGSSSGGSESEDSESASATITILDNDAIGGLLNRNVDTVSTGVVKESISNGTVAVDLHQGQATLVLPLMPAGYAPTYQGDDNLKPILSVETTLVPETGVLEEIEATLTFGGIKSETVTFPLSDVSSTSEVLRFVLMGDDAIAQQLGSGHYDYDVELKANVSGEELTRTIRGSTEIFNRVTDNIGETEFGDRWWVPGLDKLVADDGNSARYTDQGLAAIGGQALLRGDNTSAWYVAEDIASADVDNTIDDSETDPNLYEESGPWTAGTQTGGYSGGYKYSTAGTAKWKFDAEEKKLYQIFVTWTPGEDRTDSAQYAISDAKRLGTQPAGFDGTVTVDQRYTPGEVTYNGTSWRSLGFYELEEGANKIVVTLTSGSSGETVADAVMLVDQWEYSTPEGSFNTLVYGEIATSTVDGYYVSYLTPADRPGETDFTLINKHGGRQQFDYQGLLEERVDRNHNKTTYTYIDADGDERDDELEKITDIFGIETAYVYDASGYLDKIQEFANYTPRETDYTISGGNVTSITEPDPQHEQLAQPNIQFAYNGPGGRLSQVTNARGDATVITYDDAADGVLTDRVAKVTNPDSAGNPHAGENEQGSTETRQWEIAPYLADGLGDGNTAGTVRLGGHAAYIGNRESQNPSSLDEARATYTDARGNEWVYQVDAYGLLVAMANPALQAGGGEDVWRYQRNGHGLLQKRIEPAGGGGAKSTPLDELTTEYFYDGNTSHGGDVTRGNRTKVVYAQAALTPQGGESNISESWQHDANFNVVTSYTDPRGFSTSYDLDAFGNVQQINEPEGIVTGYEYTPPTGGGGQLPGGLVAKVTDPRGNETVRTYFTSGKDVGLVQKIEHAKTAGTGIQEAASTETFQYDTYRNRSVHIQEMDNAANRRTDYTYDDLDRLVKVERPSADHIAADGSTETARPTTTYEYDAEGLAVKVTDPLGRETSYEYDGMFRRTKTILPEAAHFGGTTSGEIERVFDANGNLVRVEDQLDRPTKYAYDERNLRTQVTMPDPGTGDHSESTWAYAYDVLGNLKSVKDPLHLTNGGGNPLRLVEYEYDALHRVIKETYPDPGGHPLDFSTHDSPFVVYAYDDSGNVIRTHDALHEVANANNDSINGVHDRETTYEYDGVNRLTKITRPEPEAGAGNAITTYEYDAASNRTVVIDAENGDEDGRYEYDALNRPVQFTRVPTSQHVAAVTTYDYNDAGERTNVAETTPDGTRETTFQYDTLGRRTDIFAPLAEHADPNTLLGSDSRAHTSIQYDQVGNRRLVEDPLGNFTGYVYDDLDRRTATIEAHPDEAGIDLSLTPEALALAGYTVTTVEFDIANQRRQKTQYVGSLADTRVYDYEYDQQGRQTRVQEPSVDGERSETIYHYDAVGNVVSEDNRITATKVLTTEYKFDNLDRLVQTIEPMPLPDEPTSATNDVRNTWFFYDIAGRQTDVVDALGRKTSFEYDDLDRTVKTLFPLLAGEATRAFTETAYNLVDAVESTTDRLGRVTDYVLDAWYRTTQTILPATEHFDPDAGSGAGAVVTESATLETEFDVLGRVTQTTDEIGNVTQNVYDNVDRLVQTILPAVGGTSPVWNYAYDIYGNNVRTIDPDGNVYTTRYDNQHRTIQNLAPLADSSATPADETVDDTGGSSSDFAFAGPDSWTEVTACGGLNDDYHTIAAGTGDNTATWTFDGLTTDRQYEVFVTWKELAGGASNAKFTVKDGTASERMFEVDQTVAPQKHLDDANTNWQSLGIFRMTDGTLEVVLSDDADGTVVADGVRIVERPPTSKTAYNEVGEVTSETDALGRTTTHQYDDQGRVVKEIYPDPDGAGPQLSPQMLYEYDLYDRVTSETYVLGVPDSDPNRPADDPDDLVTEYEYDDLHRRILERDANGDETNFAYDLVDNLLSKTDAEGNTTEYEYDAWDRVIKETITVDGTALTREYAYDHEDNLVELTDRNGRVFQYDYDAEDRVVEERWYDGDPDAGGVLTNTIVTVYDKRDRVHSVRDDFSAYTYGYDDLDRVVRVANFIDNDGDGDSDDAGDHTTPGVADVALDYAYDVDSRLTETAAAIDGTDDFLTSYSYNDRDFVTSIEQTSQAGGNAVAYKRVELSFDAADQLDSIARYASTGTSQLVASSSFAYDDASRLTSITHAKDANTLAEYRWQYDEANRVSAFSSLVDGTALYTYDDREQLTGEFYVDQYIDGNGDFQTVSSGGYDSSFQPNLAYQYDANGNRRRRAKVDLPDRFDPDHVDFDPTTQFEPIGDADTSESYTESGVTVTSTDDFDTPTGTHNRIETDGTHDYLFDDQGNEVRKTHKTSDAVEVYDYDVRNRLVKVTFYASTADADAQANATKTVEYTYDLHDRRIGKTVDTDGDGAVDSRQRYVWDVAAMDGKGNVVLDFVDDDLDGTAEGSELDKRYLWGQAVDQLFAQEDVNDLLSEGEVQWALTDNLGTVRDVVEYDDATDATSVAEHFTYEAFGAITSGDTSVTRYTYTAQEYDADTGLFYYDKRWYRPATGRFTTPDPIEDDPTNDYRYVGNSPTNNTDPSGLAYIRVVDGNIAQWVPEWYGLNQEDDAIDLGVVVDGQVYFHPAYQLNSIELSELQASSSWSNDIEQFLLQVAAEQEDTAYFHRIVQSLAFAKYDDAAKLFEKHGQTALISRGGELLRARPRWEVDSGLMIENSLSFSEAADEYYEYLGELKAKAEKQALTAFGRKRVEPFGRDTRHIWEPVARAQQEGSRHARVLGEEAEWYFTVELPAEVLLAFVGARSFKVPGFLDDAFAATGQAALRSRAPSLFASIRGRNLAKLTNRQIGDLGETIAKQFLGENGYTHIVSLQNRSGNGIDIVARTRDGRLAFFEVKSSRIGQIGKLSARQQDMGSFVEDILGQASRSRGRYRNVDAATRRSAADLLREFRRNRADISGTVIGVDLQNGLIRVQPWR